MPEQTRAKAAKERHQLEGSLGYALRIEKASHYLEDLKNAGWTTAIFEDKETNSQA
jgi:hypothetical protein